jgi:hypothetical protein
MRLVCCGSGKVVTVYIKKFTLERKHAILCDLGTFWKFNSDIRPGMYHGCQVWYVPWMSGLVCTMDIRPGMCHGCQAWYVPWMSGLVCAMDVRPGMYHGCQAWYVPWPGLYTRIEVQKVKLVLMD